VGVSDLRCWFGLEEVESASKGEEGVASRLFEFDDSAGSLISGRWSSFLLSDELDAEFRRADADEVDAMGWKLG